MNRPRRVREDAKSRRSVEPAASVSLKYPIDLYGDGEELSELSFRRATLGDLAASDRATGDLGRIIVLVMRLCGVTRGEAEAIDARDMVAVGEAIADLVGGFDEGKEDGEP